MIEVHHDSRGAAHISVVHGEKSSLKIPGAVDIRLWHNMGYVQIGCNGEYIPVRRLLNVGDKTTGIVGDYRITVERVSVSTNKVIKMQR